MNEKNCPHCDQPITDPDNLRCIFCGELLPAETGFLSRIKFSSMNVVLTIIAVVVSMTFLLTFF